MVSDLFTERNQFEMMYLTLTELRRVHPSEDEILLQYLVPATCKAAAVLGMVSLGSREAACVEASWACSALGLVLARCAEGGCLLHVSWPGLYSLSHVSCSSGQPGRTRFLSVLSHRALLRALWLSVVWDSCMPWFCHCCRLTPQSHKSGGTGTAQMGDMTGCSLAAPSPSSMWSGSPVLFSCHSLPPGALLSP